MRFIAMMSLCGCAWLLGSTAGNPLVGIEIQKTKDEIAFLFRDCVAATAGIPIRRVSVSTLNEQKEATALICQLVLEPDAAPATISRWVYGTTPPGYRLRRCEPLGTGQHYVIRVSGAGGGYATFSLQKDGKVSIAESSCK